MIKSEIVKILQEMGGTQYGSTLLLYLEEEYKKIDSVKGVLSLDEVIGRQKALELLDNLFNFIKPKEVTKVNKTRYE